MTVLKMQQGSDEWLEARRKTIGATDIGAIIGESPWKDPRTLAAEKLGLIEEDFDPETRLRLEIGHIMEPALLRIYTLLTGRPVESMADFWHLSDDLPWASASLDGDSDGRIVEAKWTNSRDWRGDEIPGRVQAQAQWQMMVAKRDVVDVVVMDRGEPRVLEILRDNEFIDNLVWAGQQFRDMLDRGELPEPDGSESARHLIAQLHPTDNGVMLAATPEWDDVAARLSQTKEEAKAAADRQATLENAIREMLGDASGVIGKGGAYKITWKKNADSQRVNWPAIAAAYRELLERKRVSPNTLRRIEATNTETTPGPRVLRVSFKETK